MHETPLRKFLETEARPLAVVLGTNEIASAIAVRLTYDGHRVILSHDPYTPVLRRKMAFHDALFDDHAELDGIVGRRAESLVEIAAALAHPGGVVAVTPLQLMDLIVMRRFDALIDSRLQTCRVTPDLRGFAGVTIGVGANFETARNCDFSVETASRKPGAARPPSGAAAETFVGAQREGLWLTPLDVGARVYKGVALGRHAGLRVFAPMDGYLRGIARDGTFVPKGARLLEIDPRGRPPACVGTDEHARSVASAATQALRAAEFQRGRLATLAAVS